jgi:hypothetical protein
VPQQNRVFLLTPKNKWQKINYDPTWQAFFREWGGTRVLPLFLPKKPAPSTVWQVQTVLGT